MNAARMTKPPTTQPATHFRFLELPAEIQLQICELVAVRSEPVVVITTVSKHMHEAFSKARLRGTASQAFAKVPLSGTGVRLRRHAAITPPALSRVCRQTRVDVLRMFYSKNKFISCPASRNWEKELLQWLRRLGENRQVLNDLSLYKIESGIRNSLRILSFLEDRRLDRLGAKAITSTQWKDQEVTTLSFRPDLPE